jgi:UDP-glucose 4-epimerase
MTTVAITGAGGYIAGQLISFLDSRKWCRKIIGTDIVVPKAKSDKLEFHPYDIRNPDLINFWQGQKIDTLVHLAFIVDPIHDENRMYDVNVNGTRNVLQICGKLKIPHIIVASSGTAYGAWPDNPPALKEDDPIRIFPPSFSYAHHKGLVEQDLAMYIQDHPETIFNIVRPCVVYGPHTDNYLSRYLKKMPMIFLADSLDPDLQFVHEADVAALFSLLIEKKIPGAFNVAGDGVIKISEIAAMIGKRTQIIPKKLYTILIRLLWRLHVKSVEAPAGSIDYTSYPWVLDTTRAKDELGWQPRYDSRQTLQIMLETHGYRTRSI